MSRADCTFVWILVLASGIAGTNAGCAHMMENRAISAFAKSLEAKDLERLKSTTSDDFNKRALRTAESLEDFKILNIPDGKTSIVSVEELSEDKKRVTVQVGENKKEIFYELARYSSGRWVVDDIFLKQKRKGIEAYKSVSEQMDLLLTVREFMDAWSGVDREEILAVASPKFRASLVDLPPSFLAQVTRQVTGSKIKSGKFHPQASMNEKDAVVKLPRMTGETILTMELRKGRWQVSNVGIASKDDEEKLPSVYHLALAVNRCLEFLGAYQLEDKDKLGEICAPDFFKGCLSLADLKQAKLPEPQLPEHELQVRLRGNRADFTLRNSTEFVQIDMHRQPDDLSDAASKFLVSDVTIYEIESKQEKRLSALFTAQGMLEVFIDSLSRRQLNEIKHCATQDFANRVWNKLNDATTPQMPLECFDSPDVEYVAASFKGSLTKIEVRQGGVPFTYLLTDEGGRFMVDDIEWQMSGVPSSVKTTLEVLIPIQDFASGITLGRDPAQQEQALDLVRANSSNDFNKMVWTQSKFIPTSGMSADTFLAAPLKSMAMGDNEVTVVLGDNRYGAKITMRREHNRHIVDDVVLVAGPQESERLSLRNTLKTQLARGEARPPQAGQQPIVQASYSSGPDRQVKQAVLEVSDDDLDVAKNPKGAMIPPRELDHDDIDPFDDELIPVPEQSESP